MNLHFYSAHLLYLLIIPICMGHILKHSSHVPSKDQIGNYTSPANPTVFAKETELVRMKRQCGPYGCGTGAGMGGCRGGSCGAGGCRGSGCSGCGRLCSNSCSNPCGYGNRLCCDNPAPRPCVACGLASGRTLPMPTPLTAAAIHGASHCCPCCMPACLPSCVNFGGCACNRFGYDYWDYFG